MAVYGISQYGDFTGMRFEQIFVFGIGIDQFNAIFGTGLENSGVKWINIDFYMEFIRSDMMEFFQLMGGTVSMSAAANTDFD